jgi:hypothetical protein
MINTTIDKAWIKRTIRPLYAHTQATPKSQFLDPAWDRSIAIYPGMCMMRSGGENVTLIDGTGVPMGLSALYIGGDGIDELLEQGINATAVWVLTPDAEFEILSPAFDDTATWTDPTNGTATLVHASTTARPVAKLLKVNSTKKITIGGLRGDLA